MTPRPAQEATTWSVLARYLRADPVAGAYLLVRCAGFPRFSPVERALPASGAILDVGCGHGFLAVLAGARRPERRVLGIDRIAQRIATGRDVVRRAGLDNVSLEVGRIEALPSGPFEAITLVDVLMYLTLEAQAAVLADCRRRLAPGGRLVIKEQLLRPRWKARLVELQESLVVGLKTRFARGAAWREIAATGIHLWNEEALLALLGRLGLSARSRALHDWSYLSHHLVIAEAASSTQGSAPARQDGRDRERPIRTAA
jgi:SAM-dependent methyltransferase